MYGMINKAAQELIVTQFGEEQWQAVKKRAGIDIEEFDRMMQYPDQVTYDIIAAASEVLDLPAATVLGELFATPVTVTQEKAKSEGASHDVFLVEKLAD